MTDHPLGNTLPVPLTSVAQHTARRLVTTAPAAGGRRPRPADPQSPRSSQLKPPDSHSYFKATGGATPASRKWLFVVIKTAKCPISSHSHSFQKRVC